MSEGRNPLQVCFEGDRGVIVAWKDGQAYDREGLDSLPGDTLLSTLILEHNGVNKQQYELRYEGELPKKQGVPSVLYFDIVRGYDYTHQQGHWDRQPTCKECGRSATPKWVSTGKAVKIHIDPLPIAQDLIEAIGPTCDDGDEDAGDLNGECKEPTVRFINGFSGPGYAAECARHMALAVERYGAQIWRPVLCTKRQLDELLYRGALD